MNLIWNEEIILEWTYITEELRQHKNLDKIRLVPAKEDEPPTKEEGE